MGTLFNHRNEEEKRRELRLVSTAAEDLLWEQIRGRKLGGFKFRRQFGISFFVADFCCPACRLIVELDGSSHDGEDAIEYDLNRQDYLESLGFLVVRFANRQVFSDLPSVLEILQQHCKARQNSAP